MSGSEREAIAVRSLTPDEAETAAAAERICLGSEAWTAEQIKETMAATGHYLICLIDGEYAGHAGITAVLDEGYFTNIAVLPRFRRKGVGLALIAGLRSLGQQLGLSFLSLEVRESNRAAVSLYEKAGYTVRGRRKNFYKRPAEDALIMTLDLNQQEKNI